MGHPLESPEPAFSFSLPLKIDDSQLEEEQRELDHVYRSLRATTVTRTRATQIFDDVSRAFSAARTQLSMQSEPMDAGDVLGPVIRVIDRLPGEFSKLLVDFQETSNLSATELFLEVPSPGLNMIYHQAIGMDVEAGVGRLREINREYTVLKRSRSFPFGLLDRRKREQLLHEWAIETETTRDVLARLEDVTRRLLEPAVMSLERYSLDQQRRAVELDEVVTMVKEFDLEPTVQGVVLTDVREWQRRNREAAVDHVLGVAGDDDLYVLRLVCSFPHARQYRDLPLSTARFLVRLHSLGDGRGEIRVPTIFDLHPQNVLGEVKRNVTLALGPSLKFAEVVSAEAGRAEITFVQQELVPEITSRGIQSLTGNCSWDMEASPKHPLVGDRVFLILFSRPVQANAIRASFALQGTVDVHRRILSPRRFPLRMNGYSQDICVRN